MWGLSSPNSLAAWAYGARLSWPDRALGLLSSLWPGACRLCRSSWQPPSGARAPGCALGCHVRSLSMVCVRAGWDPPALPQPRCEPAGGPAPARCGPAPVWEHGRRRAPVPQLKPTTLGLPAGFACPGPAQCAAEAGYARRAERLCSGIFRACHKRAQPYVKSSTHEGAAGAACLLWRFGGGPASAGGPVAWKRARTAGRGPSAPPVVRGPLGRLAGGRESAWL